MQANATSLSQRKPIFCSAKRIALGAYLFKMRSLPSKIHSISRTLPSHYSLNESPEAICPISTQTPSSPRKKKTVKICLLFFTPLFLSTQEDSLGPISRSRRGTPTAAKRIGASCDGWINARDILHSEATPLYSVQRVHCKPRLAVFQMNSSFDSISWSNGPRT